MEAQGQGSRPSSIAAVAPRPLPPARGRARGAAALRGGNRGFSQGAGRGRHRPGGRAGGPRSGSRVGRRRTTWRCVRDSSSRSLRLRSRRGADGTRRASCSTRTSPQPRDGGCSRSGCPRIEQRELSPGAVFEAELLAGRAAAFRGNDEKSLELFSGAVKAAPDRATFAADRVVKEDALPDPLAGRGRVRPLAEGEGLCGVRGEREGDRGGRRGARGYELPARTSTTRSRCSSSRCDCSSRRGSRSR